MQGTGAPEMSVYNLVGVHADTGNTTSQMPMIEYYTAAHENIPANQWYKGNLADVLVRQPNYGGDENHHGANIRFKLADGYGEPFYLYESYLGNVINGQASAERMADGVTFDNAQKVQPLPEDNSVKLESQYIYGPDDEGWYYIRLTTQEDNINKFALLTIIAKPVRYVVRYVPSGDFPADPDENLEARSPANMPTFDHTNSDPSFQESPNGWQYDDNNGFYYDTVTNNKISITTTVPNDPKNWYKFVDWVIVDAEGNPVQVPPESQTVSLYSGELKGQVGEAAQDNSIHITSNRALDVNDVNEYSIENDGLGGNAVSVRVIRLMPTWEKIQNPYKYSVVVDWVDSLGELHQEHFDEYWDDILTDSTDKNLTVFVNKDAEPLQRWLAEHPTYLFWDEVNNAVDNKDGKAIDKIEASMNALYPELRARNDWDQPGSLYNKVLTELLKMDISGGLKGDQPDNIDDFSRLGGYAFSVHQNGGKIVIWMCEKKSGLDIRNDVQVDALSEGEEFYYTVNATSGNLPLEGIYKAYPEGFEVVLDDGTKERRIKDEDGTERKMLDSDAWLVKFENGKISNIIKNVEGAEFPENPENPVTYFTFEGSASERVNKGIILYAPLGDYTVTEVGSKSGGSYKVNLYYINDAEAHVEGTVEWRKASGDQWLRCSEKRPITEINDPDYDKILDGTYSQVSAGIKYKIGSCNKLYIMQFINQTSSLTIGNEVKGAGNSEETTFDYTVKLNLPENVKPLWEGDNENSEGYYYFNYKRGHADDHENPNSTLSFVEPGKIILTKREGASDGFNWEGTVKISSGERVVIVTSVPEQNIPQTMAQEATKPANYSIYEDRGEAAEKYPLKEITTSDSSIATSVDGSNAAGMLGAAKSHSITFWHVPPLPETGGRGVGLICISGILLMAAGLWLLSSKKTVI
ncbi:MAG: hypothetical protein J1G06_08160, partial [Oscillospiraceae bacterium]|nr:hypothetical protein [Oscillospiraceae bacterium]